METVIFIIFSPLAILIMFAPLFWFWADANQSDKVIPARIVATVVGLAWAVLFGVNVFYG